uniref:Uncharacterized protein n=1 Tax=Arundo donax TaxID=35708 RepID=A0A0A9EX26_ARUDO
MLTLRCPNVDLVLEEEAVLLSSLPLNPSSELRVIGMKPMHPQPYSKLYWKHKKLVRGVIVITDTRERLHDFHGRKTNLYVGHYKAQFLKIDCCIKKAIKEDPISLSSYTLMKRFRHPNAVTIESIYWEGNQARLLLSTVDGSFEGWVLKHGCNILFNAAWDGTTLSEVYRSMIIDLCKVLEKLIKDGICPIRICAKNLYIKLIHGVPKLKVLMDDVECVEKDESLKAKQVKNFWHGVTQMITSSLERSHFPPFNINTAGFCNFIGKDSANKLEAYPDRWSYQEKGAYLLTIVSADREKIRPLIKSSGVVWATKGTGELRTKLNQIIVDHKTDNIFYNLSVPYDYIRLCRNSFKRFNILSPELQGAFGTNEGILQKMEKWDPEIWLKLFEAIGLPA